ncbi:MAG: SoxXA-binding protein [Gammaproteobacteria bacterium]|nr:SoxXA-binding protein [Gammaproteobacteria bacterium]
MKQNLKTLLLAAGLTCISGAYLAPASAGGMSPEAAIAAARDAQKQANSVGGEWRDVGKIIRKAEKLLAQGKTEGAIKLAEQAEEQARLGYIQATSQTIDKLHI